MRKHRADFFILFTTFILMAIGLLVMYTIGPVRANFLNAALGVEQYSENYFIIHQAISVGVSVFAFFFCYKVLSIEKFRKMATAMVIIALLTNFILLVGQVIKLPFTRCELGACRWFDFGGGLSFQPAELLKFSVALYLAKIAAEYKKAGGFSGKKVSKRELILELFSGNKKDFVKKLWANPTTKFWVRYIAVVVLSLGMVIVAQKDLGSGVPIGVEALLILLVVGMPMKSFLLICGVVVLAGVGLILSSEHRRERVFTYLGMSSSSTDVSEEASDEETGDAYHIENALIAIGSGGLFGVGVGNSVQATGYLPESINDSVFAIMGETFGFVGLVAVLALFVFLLLRILRIADCSRDQFMNLVAVGAFGWVMTHVVVNIAAMTGLLPLTGITLPLLSYGGTSMMFVAGILGVVMQISQYTDHRIVSDDERIEKVETGPVRTITRGYATRGMATRSTRGYGFEPGVASSRREQLERRRRNR